jgi:type VI secretion system protein ImpJ
MTARAVHWHEGMFLRPHHFQAAQRHGVQTGGTDEKWDHHYNWGLRGIELDRDALANYRFVIRSLRARMRDGTLVSVPEDGVLPALDLRPAMEAGASATIVLAVPVLNLGQANVSADHGAEGGRYVLDTLDLEDENTGLNPQPVQVRRLNLKLLLESQNLTGYEVLRLARVEKSAKADAVPQLDEAYIPPMVACDSWGPLAAGILQAIYDRIGQYLDMLARQVVSRGISWESQAQGDRRLFEFLRVLNEAYAFLGILVFAEGVHPLTAYLELCRLVGQLAIFGTQTRRPPDLPKYDHDDLGGCFYKVKQYIYNFFEEVPALEYKERPFKGAGLRMQVNLEPAWLEASNLMFVGVKSPLSTEECIRMLTKAGQLDMKIGSSNRVDEIFTFGLPGLNFTHAPRPPQVLPTSPHLTYFQVDRESQHSEWQNVQKDMTLAIRLNQHRIDGDIAGQEVLKIRTSSGQAISVQFTLYVVPRGK